MQVRLLLFFLLFITAIVACKKSELEGNALPNQAPETYMLADTIVRIAEQRYKTQVHVQWWGNDADGFVSAYEVSYDGNTWIRVKGQDSVFNVVIPNNKDSFDFRFQVRAIDDKGLVDPSPASLVYPVKNSAPDVKYIFSGTRNPSRSFPAIKYVWEGSDPDGLDNIDHYEFFLNDTTAPAYSLPAGTNAVTFVARNLSASVSDCDVYTGISETAQPTAISGMKLNDTNYIYLRVLDKVGSRSAFRMARIFIRKPSSDMLVVNAWNAGNKNIIQNFYLGQLAAAGISGFDILQATDKDGSNYLELSLDPLTQSRVFAFFKKIFWFGDDSQFSLSLAQKSTSSFFNRDLSSGVGGRMFMVVSVTSDADPQADYFNFTPIQSLVSPPPGAGFFLAKDSLLSPYLAGWPSLKCVNNISTARPFSVPAIPSSVYRYDTLYRARITEVSDSARSWKGISNVIASRKVISSGKSNFIICSVPLDRMNGNSNLSVFLGKALKEELGF